MTLRLGGDGAITGCTSLENPDLTVSGLTISGSFDAEKVLVASGTAAAPSYTFSGDTDNGLYYAGTNSIGLATAGTNAILIDSTGNVGIGTTSPSRKLTVNGDINLGSNNKIESSSSGGSLQVQGGSTFPGGNILLGGGSGTNDIRFRTSGASTVSTERMRIDSSGRLLVGTSSASSNLGLLVLQGYGGSTAGEGTIDLIRGNNVTAGTQGLGSINFGHSQYQGASIDALSEGAWTEGSSHPSRLVFSTTADGASSPTERMRIDNSGNIGIGGSPTVFTGQNFISVHSPGNSTNIAGLDFYVSSTRQGGFLSYPSIGESLRIFSNTANSITIHNNGSERMRILPTGGLTFNGDTATANALDDYEEGTFTPTILQGADNGSGGAVPYSIQAGRYTKIGNKVYTDIFIRFATGTFSDGNHAQIGGLPFNVSNLSYGNIGASNLTRGGGTSSFHNTTNDITSNYGNANTAGFYLYKDGGVGFILGDANNVNLTGLYWIGTFCYQTDS